MEIPFLVDLKNRKLLQSFIELSEDATQCSRLIKAAIEKQYHLESLVSTILNFKGPKMIKKLLMEDKEVSTKLPKAAFSPK